MTVTPSTKPVPIPTDQIQVGTTGFLFSLQGYDWTSRTETLESFPVMAARTKVLIVPLDMEGNLGYLPYKSKSKPDRPASKDDQECCSGYKTLIAWPLLIKELYATPADAVRAFVVTTRAKIETKYQNEMNALDEIATKYLKGSPY